MKLKGVDKFLEKVPGFTGNNKHKIPIVVLPVITVTIISLLVFANLPSWISITESNSLLAAFSPVFGFVLIEIVGFILVWQMWWRRDSLKEKYGDLSYQKIFRVGISGVIIEIFLGFHGFFPVASIGTAWGSSLIAPMVTPLTSYLPFPQVYDWIRLVVGIYFLVIGFTMLVRALFTFGIDYMAVVYLYFPEESEIQEREIYSVLRHPTYGGLVTVITGAMFFYLSPYNIIIWACFLIGFTIHIRFVEERELVERFGESYKKYMRETPAFFAKPRTWPAFFRFIAGKEK